MEGMDTQEAILQLEQFRRRIYDGLDQRADAAMDLIDALSINTSARSVVELSLSPCFRREYSSVYDAIMHCFQASSPQQRRVERRRKEQAWMRIIAKELPRPQQRGFWLFGMDTTSLPRPFAYTLPDRGFVHHSNPIRGNKPITIGHQYSALACLPEKTHPSAAPWIVPLLLRRVTTQETPTQVGVEQLAALMGDDTLPFHHELCAQVEDSGYGHPKFLSPAARYDNLITIARLRGNRVLYRPALLTPDEERGRGHPTWYGERFALQEPTTWGAPNEVAQTIHTSRRGHTYTVHIEAWHDLLMRGKRGYPMHQHPFTLVRIRMLDAKGQPAFRRTLWLAVVGQRRHELPLLQVYEAYRQRYDLEHFFRWGKQRLLLASFQTPDVEHEENWSGLVQLAYVQLWLARSLAETMPRPWERYLPQPASGVASPTTVQRDFGRIIRQIGTPAAAPKGRGKSPGRIQGTRLAPRKRHRVVKKGKQTPQLA
jgi:hypothetical protein